MFDEVLESRRAGYSSQRVRELFGTICLCGTSDANLTGATCQKLQCNATGPRNDLKSRMGAGVKRAPRKAIPRMTSNSTGAPNATCGHSGTLALGFLDQPGEAGVEIRKFKTRNRRINRVGQKKKSEPEDQKTQT